MAHVLEKGCSADSLFDRLLSIRERTLDICAPLETEDLVVQPIAEVSPPKWHLGHTTWFFEKFLLERYLPDYQPVNEHYALLFNSYYKSAGRHWLQQERGALSRPTVKEIHAYRARVEAGLARLVHGLDDEGHYLLEVGIQHEQQHQELLMMDIKYILGVNPLQPRYGQAEISGEGGLPATWISFDAGLHEIGAASEGFAYDNEYPRHKVWLNDHLMSSRLVTNREYLEFIEDGAYSDPRLWLSKGWDWVNRNRIDCPLYWHQGKAGDWREFTLDGLRPLQDDAPVCHVSYFEADAFARWRDARLPTEQEYELYLNAHSHRQQVWGWTQSHYSPYPGFRPSLPAIAEYNGKFMCNQFVLRGGCHATPPDHYRPAYRNFFEPHQRWMFAGIRLARDSIGG